jgi:NADH-quinone oxidoreductase subunit J
MVSVGAVIVLSMITILTINSKEENLPDERNRFKWIFFSCILVTPFTILLYKSTSSAYQSFSTTQTINSEIVGKLLFSEWVLPFEIVSILLLIAMLGAVVIARESSKKPEENL